MLAAVALAGWFDFLIAPVFVWVIVSILRSVNQTYDRWKKNKEAEDDDGRSISEFLFGTEANPRTRTPAREGWTTQVDRRLKALDEGQLETIKLVKTVIKNQENGSG